MDSNLSEGMQDSLWSVWFSARLIIQLADGKVAVTEHLDFILAQTFSFNKKNAWNFLGM